MNQLFGFRLKNPDAGQQDDEQQDWRDELDHCNVKPFAGEFFAVEGDFIECGLRLGNPANQNTGEQADNRHEEVVACVVEDVENLADAAVRKLELEVEDVVAEAHDNRNDKGACRHNER